MAEMHVANCIIYLSECFAIYRDTLRTEAQKLGRVFRIYAYLGGLFSAAEYVQAQRLRSRTRARGRGPLRALRPAGPARLQRSSDTAGRLRPLHAHERRPLGAAGDLQPRRLPGPLRTPAPSAGPGCRSDCSSRPAPSTKRPCCAPPTPCNNTWACTTGTRASEARSGKPPRTWPTRRRARHSAREAVSSIAAAFSPTARPRKRSSPKPADPMAWPVRSAASPGRRRARSARACPAGGARRAAASASLRRPVPCHPAQRDK